MAGRPRKYDATTIEKRYGIYHPQHQDSYPVAKKRAVDLDGPSDWGTRFRATLHRHLTDLGGEFNCSHAEQALAQRASCLIVELELLEGRFAQAGGAKNWELLEYGRATNTLARTLKLLGLQRRSRDVTPTLDQYLRRKPKTVDDEVQEAAE